MFIYLILAKLQAYKLSNIDEGSHLCTRKVEQLIMHKRNYTKHKNSAFYFCVLRLLQLKGRRSAKRDVIVITQIFNNSYLGQFLV